MSGDTLETMPIGTRTRAVEAASEVSSNGYTTVQPENVPPVDTTITNIDTLTTPPFSSVHTAPSSASSKQNDLLSYLFSPGPLHDTRYGYNDSASLRQCEAGESDLWEELGGQVWSEEATSANLAMDQEAMTEYVSVVQ